MTKLIEKTQTPVEEMTEKKKTLFKYISFVAIIGIGIILSYTGIKINDVDKACKIANITSQTITATALVSERACKSLDISTEQARIIAEGVIAGLDEVIKQLDNEVIDTSKLSDEVYNRVITFKDIKNNKIMQAVSKIFINELFKRFDKYSTDKMMSQSDYIKILKSIQDGIKESIKNFGDMKDDKK